MQLLLLPAALFALASVGHSAALDKHDLLQELQHRAMEAFKKAETSGTVTNSTECSVSSAPRRKDWNVMNSKERKSYISAVQCMVTSPSKSDPIQVPGAKTRYDDFVAQHINQTLSIHRTGNFLSWHRYYVYAYEKALRDECGYDGYQPYWNWFTYQDNLKNSPIFDGSDTSMGGDGFFVAHNGSAGGRGTILLPSGEGGGCIKSGPFKNLQINLGPISPSMAGESKVSTPLAYNPRCAKRDLTTYSSTNWLTFSNLHNITLGAASHDLLSFQNELQGRFEDGVLGLHAAGHFAIGGDAGDFYSSPNDPVFFMHHTMLDQVWWIWQALHPEQARSVAATITGFDKPPSRNATLEDTIEMNWLGVGGTTIGEVAGMEGPLCYVYV